MKREAEAINFNPPSEVIEKWTKEVNTFGYDFTCGEVLMAYTMSIGYRIAMYKFSQFIDKETKQNPEINAIKHWFIDGVWIDDLDTEARDSIIERASFIRYGMEHPLYGDSDEYKELYNKKVEEYENLSR